MKASRTPNRPAGFTLVELLLVVALIALLAGLLFPAVQTMIHKADSLACQNNLRQLGVAVQNAVQDNNNTYPYIEPAPGSDKPLYEPEGDIKAKSLLDTLSKYGITPKTVQCPADLKTLSGANAAAYAREPAQYCSYLWVPFVNDEKANGVQIYTRRGRTFSPNPAKLRLITDAQSVHRRLRANSAYGGQNVLYADGHVVGF